MIFFVDFDFLFGSVKVPKMYLCGGWGRGVWWRGEGEGWGGEHICYLN